MMLFGSMKAELENVDQGEEGTWSKATDGA